MIDRLGLCRFAVLLPAEVGSAVQFTSDPSSCIDSMSPAERKGYRSVGEPSSPKMVVRGQSKPSLLNGVPRCCNAFLIICSNVRLIEKCQFRRPDCS